MPINIRIPNARPPFRATALLLFLLSCLPLQSQVLTTLDTFTLNASGGDDVPRSLIQGSDGNLYATVRGGEKDYQHRRFQPVPVSQCGSGRWRGRGKNSITVSKSVFG